MTTTIIPLVISGSVSPTQPCIMMHINNNSLYYLVLDINKVPYFQPLYSTPGTGGDVFQNFSEEVIVTIGFSQDKNNVTCSIKGVKEETKNFSVNAANQITAFDPALSSQIPMYNPTFADPTLLACGRQYSLKSPVAFLITDSWSNTPNSRSVQNISVFTASNFYLFPTQGLINSSGNPSKITAQAAIYQDAVSSLGGDVYLFSNQDAYNIGRGSPFSYSLDGNCDLNTFGKCNGNYNNCIRKENENFECTNSVSAGCKAVFSMIFVVPILVFMILFVVIFFKVGKKPADVPPGLRHNRLAHTRNTKILLAFLLIIPLILIIVMAALLASNTSGVNSAISGVCGVSKIG